MKALGANADWYSNWWQLTLGSLLDGTCELHNENVITMLLMNTTLTVSHMY